MYTLRITNLHTCTQAHHYLLPPKQYNTFNQSEFDINQKVFYNKKVLIHGGIAQLGERLNGIQEVSGSIPLISTIRKQRVPE